MYYLSAWRNFIIGTYIWYIGGFYIFRIRTMTAYRKPALFFTGGA